MTLEKKPEDDPGKPEMRLVLRVSMVVCVWDEWMMKRSLSCQNERYMSAIFDSNLSAFDFHLPSLRLLPSFFLQVEGLLASYRSLDMWEGNLEDCLLGQFVLNK